MGVYTSTQSKRDDAKQHISEAIKLIQEVIDPEYENEFSDEYLNDLAEINLELFKIRGRM